MDAPLILNFRFSVSFLSWGVLGTSIDARFQSVSGLGADVGQNPVAEGGQNLYSHRLPTRVSYQNLVLKRGKVVGSLLNVPFDDAFGRFKFRPTDVLVMLLGDDRAPISAWLFQRAYPLKWSTGELNATDPAVLIDTLELAFSRMQTLQL